EYRHVIDWLVRKPGAFADYRYRQDLFPSSRFRLAYDLLWQQQPERAVKEYLQILYLAARRREAGVEEALRHLLQEGRPFTAAAVEEDLGRRDPSRSVTEVSVAPVDLALYDALLDSKEAEDGAAGGREGSAGAVLEGPASAHLPVELRGPGAAGAAGGAQLRALPAGVGGAGVPGAGAAPDRTVAAGIATAAGEELARPGSEAVA